MNVSPASTDMKRAIDEGSRAMERVVYIHHLPAPIAFDPNHTPLKCVCLCAGPNRGVCVCVCARTCVCVKHCMQVMSSSFSDTHTEVHIHTNACAWASTHSHTHTEGKLNGKMFLSPQIYACLQTTPQTFFLSGGGLSQMAMQMFIFIRLHF